MTKLMENTVIEMRERYSKMDSLPELIVRLCDDYLSLKNQIRQQEELTGTLKSMGGVDTSAFWDIAKKYLATSDLAHRIAGVPGCGRALEAFAQREKAERLALVNQLQEVISRARQDREQQALTIAKLVATMQGSRLDHRRVGRGRRVVPARRPRPALQKPKESKRKH